MLSATNFIQTLNAWNAPIGVLNAIKEFNKVCWVTDYESWFPDVAENVDHTHNHFKMINFDINQRGGPKVATLLQYASNLGSVDAVDALLDADADPNVCDQEDNCPLMDASENGHVQIVRKLLDKKADINLTGIMGRTALFYACTFDRQDVVTVLLDAKADPNICDFEGQSPLMEASRNGYIKIIQKLLVNNADIFKKNNDGKTALSLAVRRDCRALLMHHSI